MNNYTKKLKRLLIKILHPFAVTYWYVRRPQTRGVKAVIRNGSEVLMIKMSYGHGMWTFPGGGVSARETPLQAVQREVTEEVGVSTFVEIIEIGSYQTVIEYKSDTVYCFAVAVSDKNVAIDEVEVVEAEWFDINQLPKPRAKQVDSILMMCEK